MPSLFMKLSFIHLIRFRVDNARVFQRVSLAKPHADYCFLELVAGWLRPAFAESYRLLTL